MIFEPWKLFFFSTSFSIFPHPFFVFMQILNYLISFYLVFPILLAEFFFSFILSQTPKKRNFFRLLARENWPREKKPKLFFFFLDLFIKNLVSRPFCCFAHFWKMESNEFSVGGNTLEATANMTFYNFLNYLFFFSYLLPLDNLLPLFIV